MPDPLEEILQLVADGVLTAAEAAPILDALGAAGLTPDAAAAEHEADAERDTNASSTGGSAKSIRVEITEGGRKVINLRVPVSLGRMALDQIPGLSGNNADLVRRALADGRSGPVLVIDDEGDGVRIVLE
ncbi:MAG TPA: hypothetical protein VFY18_10865 [Candidatus Limnocylindrales bacterium]|nr:hypothetical protein [Candidatus Limnocylindrales bacterium]